MVVEDVADDYVSIGRAARDYGVVIRTVDQDRAIYEVDAEATEKLRAEIRAQRRGWLKEDPEAVAKLYREGKVDQLDLVRRYGVILDWATGELAPNSTREFREMVEKRSAAHWRD
jgi:N-methylhydantoinase B